MLAIVPFVICHAGHEYVQHMVHMRSNLASLCFAVHCCAAVRNHMVHKCVLGARDGIVRNMHACTSTYDRTPTCLMFIAWLVIYLATTKKAEQHTLSAYYLHRMWKREKSQQRRRHQQRKDKMHRRVIRIPFTSLALFTLGTDTLNVMRSAFMPFLLCARCRLRVPVVRVPQMCHEYLRQNFHSMRLLFLV